MTADGKIAWRELAAVVAVVGFVMGGIWWAVSPHFVSASEYGKDRAEDASFHGRINQALEDISVDVKDIKATLRPRR